MNTVYCETNSAFFALGRGKMPKLMPIEQARQRHELRQSYEAIIMRSGRPHYVISADGEFLSVAFMDECGRCYLEYDFQERKPNRVFLTHATHREFIGDSEDLSNYKMFAFDENGHIAMGDCDPISNTVMESETQHSAVENWDDYPQFGDYARLCREERS